MAVTTNPFRPTAPQANGGYSPTREAIPRFGMFAGPNYAGGGTLGANVTPGTSTWSVAPVNFIDRVTRTHDINYTWIEKVYTGSDAATKLAKDQAFWRADKEMLMNVMAWRPPEGDWISAMYREALIKGFSAKALGYSGVDLQKEWVVLGQLDSNYAKPPIAGYATGFVTILGTANTGFKYQLYGLESLTGTGLNVQQMLLFNQHISTAQAASYLRNQDEGTDPPLNFDNKVIIPQQDLNVPGRYFADAVINGKTVRMAMTLEPDKLSVISFTREIYDGSTLISRQSATSSANAAIDDFGQSSLTVTKTTYANGVPTTTNTTIATPVIQALTTSAHTDQIAGKVINGEVAGMDAAAIKTARTAETAWRNGQDAHTEYGITVESETKATQYELFRREELRQQNGDPTPVNPADLPPPISSMLPVSFQGSKASAFVSPLTDTSIDAATGIELTRTFSPVRNDVGELVGVATTFTQRDSGSRRLIGQYETYRDDTGIKGDTARAFDGEGRLSAVVVRHYGQQIEGANTNQIVTTNSTGYNTTNGAVTSRENTVVVTDQAGLFKQRDLVAYNAAGIVSHRELTTSNVDGSLKIVAQAANGSIQTTTRRQLFDDPEGQSVFDEITNHLTGEVILLARGTDGTVKQTTLVTSAQGWDNLSTEIKRQRLEDGLYGGVADFLMALRNKDKVGLLLAGGKMALDYQRLGTLEGPGQLDAFLSGASSTVGILGALHGLQSKNTLTQVGSAVSLLRNANSLVETFSKGAGLSGASLTLLNQIGAGLSIAGLANVPAMIENGQYVSAVGTTVQAVNAIAYLAGATTTVTGKNMGVRSCIPTNRNLVSVHGKTLANRISRRAIPRHLAWRQA